MTTNGGSLQDGLFGCDLEFTHVRVCPDCGRRVAAGLECHHGFVTFVHPAMAQALQELARGLSEVPAPAPAQPRAHPKFGAGLPAGRGGQR